MTRSIIVLGSTGKIGIQALEIIANYSDHFKLVGISGHQNLSLLEKQIIRFSPSFVAVCEKPHADFLKVKFPNTVFFYGTSGLTNLVSQVEAQMVCVAIVGTAALQPTLAAIESGKDIALASKEVLVAAGHLVNSFLRKYKRKLYPIDSEHAAIDLCLNGFKKPDISRLILTASGGPFLHQEDLSQVTLSQALKHPNWIMGDKITIDSATLINKGLEVIEAHWLFRLPYSKIDVLIHPQSVVHGMIELRNGAIIAQLSAPTMKMPILYALSSRKILPFREHPLRLENTSLEFLPPDLDKFRGLKLAYEVGLKGQTWPTSFSAANEEAVSLFLHNKIRFDQIVPLIEHCLEHHQPIKSPSLEDILAVDRQTRITLHAHHSSTI